MGSERNGTGRIRRSYPSLSVVVVTYNERERIGACLESVFDCCEEFDDLEVVVVDSNSTDGTVEVAREFPVGIYRITEDEWCTPGAGRYVGTQVTDSEQILFVDGDMQLRDGWVSTASELVSECSSVVGVDGQLNDADTDEITEHESLRGVVLYDRSTLEAVGGFDPHLQALEDVELGYRLTSQGHRLVRLPAVVASHSTESGVAERRRRWANGYYFGHGQFVRKSVRNPRVLGKVIYRYRRYLFALGWLPLGFVALGEGDAALLAWTALTVGLFAYKARQVGARTVLWKLSGFPLVYAGFLVGLLTSFTRPDEFPMSVVEQVEPAPKSRYVAVTRG